MNGGSPVTILFVAHDGTDLGLFAQLIHPEDRPSFLAAGAGGAFRPAGFACRMALPSGPWLWTRWLLATGPGQLQGALQQILAQHGDQLVQCQKAGSAGILVSGLGHAFHHLVGAIAACAAALARTDLPPDRQDALAGIRHAADRAQDLVRQLLDFARKDQEPPKGVHCLNGLAREAAALLAHMDARGVRLETEFCPGTLEALVEPGQIRQLLLNLGLNALEALGGPGIITLRSGRQRVGPRESAGPDCLRGAYAFLEVEDSGRGIAPEHLERIYDPFFTTKPAGLGTGLGLALAQAIARGHDGLLQCRSEPNRGTRIRALLPEARPARARRPLRVLLVEDTEADARLILAALGAAFEPRPLRVDSARALAEALAEGPWDLILAGRFMPFDGLSALALARERAPGIPFIFVSGALDEGFSERALGAGARDCLPKHRLDLLLRVVEQELE